MNLTLILILIILLVSIALVIFVKKYIKQVKENKALEDEIKKKNESISYLYLHAEEIMKLNDEKDKIENEINNAESNEEIADIISAIVTANNSKLHVY